MEMSNSGFDLLAVNIMEVPFQEVQYWYHRSMSDRAGALRLMKWPSCLAVVDKSISLRRKERPALTALQAGYPSIFHGPL